MVDLFTVNITVWQSSTGIVTFLAWLTCYVNFLSFYMTRAFTILSYCNKIPTTTYIYKQFTPRQYLQDTAINTPLQ